MRTSIVMLVLVLGVTAIAQTAPQQPSQPSQPPAAGAPAGQAGQPAPQQQKTIKDPAEYNAYLNAIQQSSPAEKAIALEGFVQQYPNSVVKEDALEQLMAAYQQTNNLQKVTDTANRVLQVNPNNLRALALMSYLRRQQAEAGQNAQQNLAEAAQFAQRGLQALQTAPKPEGMSDADFAKLKNEMGGIFAGAAGLAALQNKNYPEAQQLLSQSVKANPNNLGDVYPLALSYLQAQPPDYVNGLWFIARAVNLAGQNAAAQQQINKFGRAAYIKYHGNDQGWQDVVTTAASNPLPPANFQIQPRPTPAQEAAQLVQQKQVKDMSFDEFQLIFTSGNQQAIDAVWNQIKDKPIAFAAKVAEASPTKLTLSATAEDIEKNVPDVVLTMVAAIPARLLPKAGGMTQVEGTPVSYTAQPFQIVMNKGSLLGAPKAETPAPKRTTPSKRPAR